MAEAAASEGIGWRALTLRRIHALTGAAPLGVFLLEHVVVTASALGGQGRFDRVTGVTGASALTATIDVVFVLVPLAYHALYGIFLAATRRPSAADDPMRSARLAWLMRASGIVTLVFVAAHVWEYRVRRAFFGLSALSIYGTLAERLSTTWGGVPWVALGTIVGIAATSFHFAYGLLRVRSVFGVAQDAAQRRRSAWMSAVLGGALFVVGVTTVVGLATGTRLLPPDDPGMTRPCGSTDAPPAPEGPSP